MHVVVIGVRRAPGAVRRRLGPITAAWVDGGSGCFIADVRWYEVLHCRTHRHAGCTSIGSQLFIIPISQQLRYVSFTGHCVLEYFCTLNSAIWASSEQVGRTAGDIAIMQRVGRALARGARQLPAVCVDASSDAEFLEASVADYPAMRLAMQGLWRCMLAFQRSAADVNCHACRQPGGRLVGSFLAMIEVVNDVSRNVGRSASARLCCQGDQIWRGVPWLDLGWCQ